VTNQSQNLRLATSVTTFCKFRSALFQQSAGIAFGQSCRSTSGCRACNSTKGLWSKPLLLAAALALLSGSASAQMPGAPVMRAPRDVQSQAERQRQKQIDNDYKAATKNIPNQKPKDPWGDVRPTPTVKGQ
jgi:hypothetical protein